MGVLNEEDVRGLADSHLSSSPLPAFGISIFPLHF
jgi:hypothetical protein